jgi:hypothetical protein
MIDLGHGRGLWVHRMHNFLRALIADLHHPHINRLEAFS